SLIGEVLAARSDPDVFIMTKAGYVQGKAFDVLERLRASNLAPSGTVYLADGFAYSLHPDFLCCQIEISLGRLRRDGLDGFLLHNPEHYFGQAGGRASRAEFDALIADAFAMLEDLVSEGKIRYYGVSSNTLTSPLSEPDATDLGRLLSIAARVARDH